MDKMDKAIVLININSDLRFHPSSVLCVGSALKQAGFKVHIYNIAPEEAPGKIKQILALKPLFVGFSVFTGPRTAIAAEMSSELKRRDPAVMVVWGGIHPSLVPEQCLKEGCIDIVVIGEGEETAVELAQALVSNAKLEEIQGLGFKSGGRIIINKRRPLINNLDDYKLDWSLVNMDECIETDIEGIRYLHFMSSRGCPFNCGFCYNFAFNERRWRPHSFEYVTEEIIRLKQVSGINGIVFNDDNFMVDIERAFKILRFLKDNGIRCVRLEMRLESLSHGILQKVSELGVINIFVGWESGSNRILKLINKGITREDIIEKFKLFSRHPQLAVSAAAIIGFPTETWGDVCETIDLGIKIAELVPANIITFQTYLPYPGTDLYPLAVKGGLNVPQRSKDWGGYNTFYGNMKLEWLPWAKNNTTKLFYRIDKYGKLLNRSKSSSFLRTLGKKICYFLARARIKCRFFAFPVEIFILHRFNRYYLDSKGKVVKR